MTDRRNGDETDSTPTIFDRSWMERALESSSDPTFVLDTATTEITWANTAAGALVGLERGEVLGHSLAEFVHPDDLIRAAEVLRLADDGIFDDLPITPALYRVRGPDGEWVSVGVNASLPQPDGSLLVVARVGGDLVIADQLLEAVTAHAPFDELASLVLELARWRHPDEGYVIFYDDETGHRQKITASRLAPELTGDRSVEGPTPWETAARAGTDVVIEDLRMVDSAEPSISAELADFAVAAGMGGCIAAPVVDPAGMVDAVIVIWTTRSGPTHAGHGYALANMRRALALVLQHRAQRILLERAARVDALTGVWSRAGFFELIEGVSPDTAPTGYHVLYVDLDGFKEVNDSHGHSTGDQVLTTAAARLVELGPENSIVGRLGGDEFVLVCPRQPGDDPVETARRIVDVMALPIETTEGSVSIGASVGIASSRDASSFQQVLDRADAALLRAKSQGRARWITHGTSAHSSQVDTNAR